MRKEVDFEGNVTEHDDAPIVEQSVEEKQAQQNSEALQALNIGDYKVIRELERMFLKDTPLNIEREQLRESIV